MKKYLVILEVEFELNEYIIISASNNSEADSKFQEYANKNNLLIVNNESGCNYEILEIGSAVKVI